LNAEWFGGDLQGAKWWSLSTSQFEAFDRVAINKDEFLGSILVSVTDNRGNNWTAMEFKELDFPTKGRNAINIPFELPTDARLVLTMR